MLKSEFWLQKGVLGIMLATIILTGCGDKSSSCKQSVLTVKDIEETAAEKNTEVEPEDQDFVQDLQEMGSIYTMLNEETVDVYLEDHGMEDISPVCFYDPGEAPRMKLYFDRETGRGCGLKYEETKDGSFLLGFAMEGYDDSASARWNYPNPYSTHMVYDEGFYQVDQIHCFVAGRASDLEESCTYTQEGRPCTYQVRGCVEAGEGKGGPEDILTIFYSYREDGTLQEKVYQLNEKVNLGGEQRYVYDGQERLQYAQLDINGEYYLIYEGDSMTPSAYLEVYPFYSRFVRMEERDYYGRVELPGYGIDAFLHQTGLSPQDQFYKYQWHNESSIDTGIWSHSDISLTLYFDPERELGCGYMDYFGEPFEDMSGFMFRGCMEIDCKGNDPYGVFVFYDGTLGSLPPEELPNAYEHESMYVCDYDGDRLMRIWMYGTGSDTERFFIYDGDSKVPSYCLNWVYGTRDIITLFKFVY